MSLNLNQMKNLYQQSIKTLQARADKIFSEFIRRRDTPGGIGKCCTCGKFITYETCDAGHWQSRGLKNTRYNGLNVAAQCISCNRFQEGRKDRHRDFIEKKYGISKRYLIESLAHQKCTDYKFLLINVIENYTIEVEELRKQ